MTKPVLSIVPSEKWIEDLIANSVLEMPIETLQDPDKRFMYLVTKIKAAWELIEQVKTLD